MAEPAVHFFAPAKVNLYLHVIGRRENGYHELDSLIVFAGVGDEIIVRPGDGLTLAIEGTFATEVPSGPDNLVLKAAQALAAAANVKAKAEITLIKRLPVASGVGGGSADAAAVLNALSALWEVDIGEAALAETALKLGADVPVCLRGKSAFIEGIGEHIKPAPVLPEAWLVLVNPGVELSTPQVFAAREDDFSEPAPFTEAPADAGELARLLAARRNDLTVAACGLAPEVAEALAVLEVLDGVLLARMSGSGATCFALFEGEGGAKNAAARLTLEHPGWWVAAAPLINDTANP